MQIVRLQNIVLTSMNVFHFFLEKRYTKPLRKEKEYKEFEPFE